MYTKGICANYSFSYSHEIAPSLKNLAFWSRIRPASERDQAVAVVSDSLPLPPIVFSLYVLPPTAWRCLAKPLQPLAQQQMDLDTIRKEVEAIPADQWEGDQATLVKGFVPSLILTRSLPNSGGQAFQTPLPPVKRFKPLRTPSGVSVTPVPSPSDDRPLSWSWPL